MAVWRYCWQLSVFWFRSARLWSIASAATVPLLGVMPAASALALGETVRRVTQGGSVVDAAIAPLPVLAVGLAQQAVGALRQIATTRLQLSVDLVTRTRLRGAVLQKPFEELETPAVADEIKVVRDLGPAGSSTSSAVPAVVAILSRQVALVATTAVLAGFTWWLPLPLLVGRQLIQAVLMRKVARTVATTITGTPAIRRADYFYELATGSAAARENWVFNLWPWHAARHREQSRTALADTWTERSKGWASATALAAGAALAVFVVGLHVVREATQGAATTAEAAIVLTAALSLFASAPSGGEELFVSYSHQCLRALKRLEAKSGTRQAAVVEGTTPLSEISLENISYRYATRDEDALSGVSLVLRRGESIALVGLNGAGKSTLVKILCGLYAPHAGTIRVNGRTVGPDERQLLRDIVAPVFQDFAKFELPALANVTLDSRPEADGLALEAASASQFGEVVRELPSQWHTTLSRHYTDGVDISGGEWQRLAMARALLSETDGREVLILDEPTAHLDPEAEARFVERFLSVRGSRTTVLISHRFSTVRNVDRIIVLDEGRIIESGAHDDLIALGGTYARLFRLQAAPYQSHGDVG